ncbi:hypothetical protein ACS0TY_012547 [Phlomoides rotata]
MDYSVILNVIFKGESKLIEVNGCSSFTQVQSQILGTWLELDISTVNCRYSVGTTVRNCCLGSDVDLKNMLFICQHTLEKIVIVDVDSSFTNVDKSSIDSNMRDSQKSCPNSRKRIGCTNVGVQKNGIDVGSSSNREFTGKGVMPSYEMCPRDNRKSYLSDHWLEIMNDGVGKEFDGRAVEFRMELIKYTTRLGYKFKYVRNDARYIHAVCNNAEKTSCPWFIKARRNKINKKFVVSTLNVNHECIGGLTVQKKTRLGAVIIAKLVLQSVRADPTCSPKDIMHELKESYGFDILYWKAWRVVEGARNLIFGTYDEFYDNLRWYCNAIQRTNPGSSVDLVKNSETHCFERVFIAFKACIDGFIKCRPMLFIDGTFMKGRAKGILLSATTKDGDNGMCCFIKRLLF